MPRILHGECDRARIAVPQRYRSTKAGEHEQRVIDTEPEANHRDHVARKDAHARAETQEIEGGAPDRYGSEGHDERQAGSDRCPEKHEKNDERDRNTDALGLQQIGRALTIEIEVRGCGAGHPGTKPVRERRFANRCADVRR